MIHKILSGISIFTLTTCFACGTHASKSRNIPTQKPVYPTVSIPLPILSFKLNYPPAPKLEAYPVPKKAITDSFSATDKTQIAIKDPKRFADTKTEIIDLSLIPKEDYAFPLPNGKVISSYGGKRRGHTGVDIKTCPNDTILAAFNGIVRMAKPYAAYGNVIVIRHPNGLETIYSHNSKNLVKPGDRVNAGQPIALTGRTGRATTEHLHFETRINGQHFNPNIIFNMTKRKLHKKCLVCTLKGGNIAIKSVDVLPHQKAGAYQPKEAPLSIR